MNTAVIYSSKTGTSARCAARLAEHLEADLLEISGDFPDIAAYYAVLLGGGVRMGRLPRPLRRWTALHTAELLQMPLGLFLCCCLEKEAETYFRGNFPAELLEHACCRACLGGELDPDALQGTDRLVAGLAIRSFGFATLPRLDLHRADAFVQRFLIAHP